MLFYGAKVRFFSYSAIFCVLYYLDYVDFVLQYRTKKAIFVLWYRILFHWCPKKRNLNISKQDKINIIYYDEGLSVPKAHNLINPTLNTVGVQCGVTETIPMRVEDTLHHINQQGGVPPARRIRVSVPTSHGTSLRVGFIRLRASSTYIGLFYKGYHFNLICILHCWRWLASICS